MKDFRLNFKVRNNRILHKIEECGFSTVGAFCRAYDLRPSEVGELVNLKRSPFNEKHRGGAIVWISIVVKLAEILCCEPEDLFSDSLLRERRMTQAQMEVDAAEIVDLLFCARTLSTSPEVEFNRRELAETIDEQLSLLTPREEHVLRARFCFDEQAPRTLLEVGEELGVTAERIRQMEGRALRKLRGGRRRDALLPWSRGR